MLRTAHQPAARDHVTASRKIPGHEERMRKHAERIAAHPREIGNEPNYTPMELTLAASSFAAAWRACDSEHNLHVRFIRALSLSLRVRDGEALRHWRKRFGRKVRNAVA